MTRWSNRIRAPKTPDEPVGARWSRWYEANIDRSYMQGAGGVPRLSGIDAYEFRCALLHEGSAQPSRETRHGRIIFVEPGGPTTFHLDGFELGDLRALAIDAPTFVRDMTTAARAWLDRVGDTEPVRSNLRARVATRHAEGLEPFIGGAPVIG